jgi:hypothetical protein
LQQTIRSENMKSVERVLVGLETRPWDILYRAALGFGALLFASHLALRDRGGSEWVLVPVLITIFLAIRVIPAIVRKLVPFSKSAQEVWVQRRTMAKRYDSYQWQKLLGFGIGLALYAAFSRQFSPARIAVSTVCLVCGALGMIRWRETSRQVDAAQNAAKLATSR